MLMRFVFLPLGVLETDLSTCEIPKHPPRGRQVNRKVEIIWRADGTHRKYLRWRRPATNADLAAWMDDYIDLVRTGYLPTGFERAPLPHCARVTENGRVLAEWHLSPKRPAESPVTAEPLGPAGMPAAPPSAPSSDHLAVRKPSDHTVSIPSAAGNHGSLAVNNASTPNDGGVDQGQSVAKAGHPVESRQPVSAL